MKGIVLAGGAGDGLWPLSRKNYPKQFVEIRDGRSIFQENIARNMPFCDEFFIFTNEKYKYIVEGQLKVFQELKYKIFLETESTNTTLPVILGCLAAGENEQVFVISCNSIFSGVGYRNSIVKGKDLSISSNGVMFGYEIYSPKTEYGYIKNCNGDVEAFVEKPDLEFINSIRHQDNWLCNVGLYIFDTSTFIGVIRTKFKKTYNNILKIYHDLICKDNKITISNDCIIEDIRASIERVILENLEGLKVVELKDVLWNEIGSFESLEKVISKNNLDNVVITESSNLTVINQSSSRLVVVNGIDNAIIVNTNDAVYIADTKSKKDIKSFVADYADRFPEYINENTISYRSWGTYEVISVGDGYKVKRVTVFPHKEMHLHKHSHRTEHWAIVDGFAEITIEDNTKEYGPNTNVYVEQNAFHKISNKTEKNVVIIEVELGKHISERDIISKNYLDGNKSKYEMIKLQPIFKDYLWGGTKIKEYFGKKSNLQTIAESWEMSTHKVGNSIVADGINKGLPLSTYIEKLGKDILGWKCSGMDKFPILIKFIDADKPLSIQVHPNDDFAMAVENEYGKNEMWYIVDCNDDAFVYCGFKRNVTVEELKSYLQNGNITELLNKIPVKKGDAIFIPAGTIHAIGAGLLICEIQQNSNTTYRIYDYDRVDNNGRKRELHLDKALQVINTCKYDVELNLNESLIKTYDGYSKELLCSCKYFEVCLYTIDDKAEVYIDKSSFYAMVVLEGYGNIMYLKTVKKLYKGDTFFVPAGIGQVYIEGNCSIILCHV